MVSFIVETGDADLCFLLGTLGGEVSSRDRRLFRGSDSMFRFVTGLGSEIEAPLRTEESPDSCQVVDAVSLCESCAGAL